MPFNKDQLRAIDAPADADILIAAGAGSGKTKTLAERVFHHVDNGDINPAELLILTFTNNAAHEMKERILQRFGSKDPNYARMLSSHVQSFDSFLAYLVRSNAAELGVSPDLTIIPQYQYKQKRGFYLDQVLNVAYSDPKRRAVIVDFLRKNDWKNDAKLKSSLLYLLECEARFTPEEWKKFVAEYEERFLSDEHAKELYDIIVEDAKDQLRVILYRAYALDQIAYVIVAEPGNEASPETIAEALKAKHIWNSDLSLVTLSDDPDQKDDFLKREFAEFASMLSLDGEAFVAEARRMIEDHGGDYFAREYPGSRKKTLSSAHYHVPAFKALKEAKDLFDSLSRLGDVAQERERLLDKSEGIKELFRLCEEVRAKLDEYRLAMGAYTFADVGALALRLFLEEKENERFHRIVEGLRKRFRYIMVDEYQDTNDFQEILLNALTAPDEEGRCSHLFCVGDAKQSIYAFRNSKVELFRARQQEYLHGPEGEKMVIPMATNYRSSKRLLSDINHIFLRYMVPQRGGIDYQDPMEQLGYDDAVNLYNVELEGYGVHRILPPQSVNLGPISLLGEEFDAEHYEAKAILADIQKKVREGYLVFDRGGKGTKTRPCKYSDFCVLLRKKGSVKTYQELFHRNGIPINNQLKADLREINAVILVRTLLDLVAYFLGGLSSDVEHLFASLARSYIGGYSDERLHHLLADPTPHGTREEVIARIEAEPIMQELRRFALDHQSHPLDATFLALLDQFHVVRDLYLIGDVEDNVAKIESMYRIVRGDISLGEGLHEFIAELDDLDQRRLEIDAETVFASADAVDLMTIHASKGLERKIVYLPASQNGISKGDERSAPPFVFSREEGLLYKYSKLPLDGDLDEMRLEPYETIAHLKSDIVEVDGEADEHVRLLYVALTRAENAVFVVGQPTPCKPASSAYVMFEHVPSFLRINDRLLGYADPGSVSKYVQERGADIPETLTLVDPAAKKALEGLHQEYVVSSIHKRRKENALQVIKEIYNHYVSLLRAQPLPLDEVAKVFAYAVYPSFAAKITDVSRLKEELCKRGQNADLGALTSLLEAFQKGIVEGDLTPFLPAGKAPKDPDFSSALLFPLAKILDHADYAYYESYQSPTYRDLTFFFDEGTFEGKEGVDKPTSVPLEVDDREIDFPAIVHKRASMKAEEDVDLAKIDLMQHGSRLHRLLELTDLRDPDLSFIVDPKEKAAIEKVLSLPIMQRAKQADELFPEYGFYDEINLVNGYIDLLFVKDGVYHVVDYKTYHIDKPEYALQLRQYGENVARIFGVNKENVRLHLVSLYGGKEEDVAY